MKQQLKKVIKRIVPESVLVWWQTRSSRYLEQSDIIKYDSQFFKRGINLIGPMQQNSGLGQSCRLLERAINASGIMYEVFPLSLIHI